MPRMSVVRDYDYGANPGQEHLLAMLRLRRSLERLAPGRYAEGCQAMAMSTCGLRTSNVSGAGPRLQASADQKS